MVLIFFYQTGGYIAAEFETVILGARTPRGAPGAEEEADCNYLRYYIFYICLLASLLRHCDCSSAQEKAYYWFVVIYSTFKYIFLFIALS